jgi:hypothetical protein
MLYPNPSNKELVHLSTSQNIMVYDLSGKVLLTEKNAVLINTNSFHSGIYFVKTDTGITKKLIVE